MVKGLSCIYNVGIPADFRQVVAPDGLCDGNTHGILVETGLGIARILARRQGVDDFVDANVCRNEKEQQQQQQQQQQPEEQKHVLIFQYEGINKIALFPKWYPIMLY